MLTQTPSGLASVGGYMLGGPALSTIRPPGTTRAPIRAGPRPEQGVSGSRR
jgi:hypothetical protein